MFLFRSSTTPSEEKNVITTTDEDYMIESVYLVLQNGEAVCYKKKLEDGLAKINELVDKVKWELTLQGKQIFEEWDHEKSCRVFSKENNCIIAYDKLESVLSLKKVTNN